MAINVLNRNQNLLSSLDSIIDLQSIMRQIYIWMGLVILLTAFVAYSTANTSLIYITANPVAMLAAILSEFGMVLGISFGFNQLSSGLATLLFFGYAALNGFTLSIMLLAFSIDSVFLAFGATAALFVVISTIGYTTRMDLTKMGTCLMMGVIGLFIAMAINLFINSGPLDMLVSVVGILIFTALTAYDIQRIGRMATQMKMQAGGDAEVKFGIFGARKLYLDFNNMFLFMLRLVARRR